MDSNSGDQVLYQLLPFGIQNKVSFLLNPPSCDKDWKALAAEFGFTIEEVNSISCANDPTMQLFRHWEIKYEKRLALSFVLDSLKHIGRDDAIDDINEYINNNRNIEISSDTLQVSTSLSGDFTRLDEYDVFISYAKDDIEFAKLIVQHLEEKSKFKVCIDIRDFLPGYNNLEQIYSVIEKKCRKVIVILSPNFNKSRDCDLQAKIALSFSFESQKHKVIPILYEKCEIPHVLKYLTRLDYNDPYTKSYFWPRLINAINVQYTST